VWGVRSFTERDDDPTIDLPYFYGGAFEATMRRRLLTLAIAVAATTCCGVLATRAEDWKATGEYDWHGTGGKIIEMEKGHTYAHGESAGKFFNERGKGSLLDQAEVKCIGSFDTDTNNKKAKQGGYCVITDADGDHAYWMWESSGTPAFEVKGTFDFTGGTGKYKGITGKNTYRAVGRSYGRMIWNDGQPRKGPVLGLLGNRGASAGPDFFDDMRALGWADNCIPITLDGLPGDELADAARALVAQKPAVIVALGDSATRTVQAATTSIPIVGDMAASGIVASLARPGGNTTGISILAPELDAKRLELLHEMVPQARRIGILFDPEYPTALRHVEAAATQLGLKPFVHSAGSQEETAAALSAMLSEHVEAINVLSSPMFFGWRASIMERLANAKVPAIYQFPEMAEEGGLMGYGQRLSFSYRQLATLVDKILRGAKPADVPVEQPKDFTLAINLKSAHALGLTVPPNLLATADEVIE
jgi:putative ABC transport system substrate-binding protein